jgi:hypothetical protein
MLDLRALLVIDSLATEVWRSRNGFFVSLILLELSSPISSCLTICKDQRQPQLAVC